LAVQVLAVQVLPEPTCVRTAYRWGSESHSSPELEGQAAAGLGTSAAPTASGGSCSSNRQQADEWQKPDRFTTDFMRCCPILGSYACLFDALCNLADASDSKHFCSTAKYSQSQPHRWRRDIACETDDTLGSPTTLDAWTSSSWPG
jgi:hypothetical protein